ncbi:hypothetical protein [Nostoc sp. PCC 7107]|uniref:hypothetical protein n=1 Tax=Nostoc sp. PCC 7107 TaxID=317936 RepID=UPI00029EED1E|nr:hypothetical protein [Nostoc sp. PCC 7107]AFY43648.1 hypothetical protein Nos7107_3057 [Nostoc sp. PCC 7107]
MTDSAIPRNQCHECHSTNTTFFLELGRWECLDCNSVWWMLDTDGDPEYEVDPVYGILDGQNSLVEQEFYDGYWHISNTQFMKSEYPQIKNPE